MILVLSLPSEEGRKVEIPVFSYVVKSNPLVQNEMLARQMSLYCTAAIS